MNNEERAILEKILKARFMRLLYLMRNQWYPRARVIVLDTFAQAAKERYQRLDRRDSQIQDHGLSDE